jgi:uncharacterized membrane protein
MPFCPNCGNEVNALDRFCARCGSPQPVSSGGTGGARQGAWQDSTMSGVSSNRASVLCYLPWVGWIAGLLVLATDRFRQDRTTRFHAFQGLYLFVAWLLIDLLADNLFDFGGGRKLRILFNPLRLAIFGAWIYMMVQTSQHKLVKLPFLGELADRSVDEQK